MRGEFNEWLDRNEEVQREQITGERRLENMERIIAASPPGMERLKIIDFVLERVEKDRKRGISTDDSLKRLAENHEEFNDL